MIFLPIIFYHSPGGGSSVDWRAAVGWWFPEGAPETQYEWRKSNFNMLTSIGKLGKEFGTPNIKNLPCRIRRKLG